MSFFLRLTKQTKMQIPVTVKFEKRKEKIVEENGQYFVYTKSLPQRGEANKEVIKEIAKYFKVTEEDVKIVRGSKNRKKTISIKDNFR
jgi:uncharacterized protein